VQLIEVTDFGVRSAQITLVRRQTPLRFVLFPMVHLGSQAFYADVVHRLARCQLIVREGVSGRSLAVDALTSAYRIPGSRKRDQLVTESLDLSSLDVPTICPDMDAAQFDAGWRRLPVLPRLGLLALTPVVGAWLAVAGPRVALSHLETDGLPTREEIERDAGALEQVHDLLVRRRDALLLRCLEEIHGGRCEEAIDVGVVYGAVHMRAVIRHLVDRHGYFAREAEWMTVMAL
jgi:hypothetical protein